MSKLATLGVVLLLVTACSGHQGLSGSVSPRPSAGGSPGSVATASPSPADILSPTPTSNISLEPMVLVPVGPVGFHAQCRLPVYWWDSGTSTQEHAGFVIFPSGHLVVDRSASTGSPLFYDRLFAKWIDAERDQVSPDGRQYAYAEDDVLTGKLHIVNVATGADRIIFSGSFLPTVVQFNADGIYFTSNHGRGESYGQGLWLIAPQGGQPRLISGTVFLPVVANGAAWGIAFNAADRNPASGGITHAYNTILRYDLNTGAAATWWYHPENDMRLFDGDYSGNLYVYTFREQSGGPPSDWMLDSRGTSHLIGTANLGDLAAVDSCGVWFDDAQSVPTSYLWLVVNGQLERVAGFNVAALRVAGGCIPGA